MKVDLQDTQITKAERRAIAKQFGLDKKEADGEDVRAWLHEVMYKALNELADDYLHDVGDKGNFFGQNREAHIPNKYISAWRKEQERISEMRLQSLMNNGDISIESRELQDNGGQNGA